MNFISALTCYVTNDIPNEPCRIVGPGGFAAFSQRDLWKRPFGTEPMLYLPNHPEHGTKIKVQLFVYELL